MRAVTSDLNHASPDRQLRGGARSIRLAEQLFERGDDGRRLSRAAVTAYGGAQDASLRCNGGDRAQRRAHALDGIAFRAVHRRPRPRGARRPGELPVLERLRRCRAVVAGAPRLRAERAHDGGARDACSPTQSCRRFRPPRSSSRKRALSASRRSPPRRWSHRARRPPSRAMSTARNQRRSIASQDRAACRRRGRRTSSSPPRPTSRPTCRRRCRPSRWRRRRTTRVETAPSPTRKSVDKARNAKKRALRAYRTSNEATLRAKAKTQVGDPTKQAPKWAQQMFVTPWQSRAFSYTQ